MDKVTEKKEQHAELCKLLAAEGYDVIAPSRSGKWVLTPTQYT
jgi:hypothetical protein